MAKRESHRGEEERLIDAAIGAEITRRRTQRGLSQSRLAEAIGISFQQVQKYETGLNRVSGSKLWRIAEVLGCEAGDFFPSTTRVGDDQGAMVEAVQLDLARSLAVLTPEEQDSVKLMVEGLAAARAKQRSKPSEA